jgi:hypothetical protein
MTFERKGNIFTAKAVNGTRLVLKVSQSHRVVDGYVIAPGFGMASLYNCTLRNVGDMRGLFHKLAKADFVTEAARKTTSVVAINAYGHTVIAQIA